MDGTFANTWLTVSSHLSLEKGGILGSLLSSNAGEKEGCGLEKNTVLF